MLVKTEWQTGRSGQRVRRWCSMVESHGNHTNSASRVLRTAADRIGVPAALSGEETLPRLGQVRKPSRAPVGDKYGAKRIGYGIRRAGSVECSEGGGRGERDPHRPDPLMEHLTYRSWDRRPRRFRALRLGWSLSVDFSTSALWRSLPLGWSVTFRWIALFRILREPSIIEG